MFVAYSVIHDTLNGKGHEEVDYIFYDISDCFNSLWADRTLLDLYRSGVKTQYLNILHELTKSANISIKTPVGVTDEATIEKTIMQGETLSSVLCTATTGEMEKDCELEPYKYKNKVDIPKMRFVDDLLDITKCGEDTVKMNHYTNDEVNKCKMQLNKDKCK